MTDQERLEYLCTFPSCGCVAKGQWCPVPCAINPAAIREAALREASDVAVIHYYAAGAAMRPEFMPTRFRDAILALIGETK